MYFYSSKYYDACYNYKPYYCSDEKRLVKRNPAKVAHVGALPAPTCV